MTNEFNWEKRFDEQFFPVHLISELIKSNDELKSFIIFLIKEVIDDAVNLVGEAEWGIDDDKEEARIKQQLKDKYGIK